MYQTEFYGFTKTYIRQSQWIKAHLHIRKYPAIQKAFLPQMSSINADFDRAARVCNANFV
jgi:hypothetical protein